MGKLQNEHDVNEINKHFFFPLYINSLDKKCYVIGGGKIALRRIKTLIKFKFNITVISPCFEEEITNMASDENIKLIKGSYEESFIKDAFLVIAAVNDRQTNKKIGEYCRRNNIFVSVADKKEECNFYFPAIVDDETVISICGDGNDHEKVAKTAEELRSILKNN